MTLQTIPQHACIAITNTPDQLGNQWRGVCECGYRTAQMLHVEDMVTLLVLHGMDVTRVQTIESWGGIHVVDNPVDHGPVRRDWLRAVRAHRGRAPAPTKGLQAVPRHYHVIGGGKP